MSSHLDGALRHDAIELKKLDKQAVKLVLEGNIEELFETLQKHMDLKKKI